MKEQQSCFFHHEPAFRPLEEVDESLNVVKKTLHGSANPFRNCKKPCLQNVNVSINPSTNDVEYED